MIRKTLLAMIACLALLVPVSLAATSSPASAAGCGAVEHLTRDTSVGSDNLLVAGRPVRFTLHVDKQDCDGYDLITEMWATVHKDNGGCGNAFAKTDGYRVNPNVLGGYNGDTQFINCVGGGIDYVVFWNPPAVHLTASMPDNERCVSMHVVVDLILQGDPNLDTPTLCFNGL